MIPNPPTWISARITTCPKPLQYTGVSTMIKPVTHTAEVAVNNASATPELPAPEVAAGVSRSRVPTATAAANPLTTNCAGCDIRGIRTRAR